MSAPVDVLARIAAAWGEDSPEYAAVAELIEAGSAAHMALIGYLPAHRNAVTSCAIARIEAALARCGGQS